jgi:hypothetical protein
MEPGVRSPRTESAIITDRAQNGGFGLPRLPYSRLPKGIGRGNPGAGNGIFGCRDGRLKIGLRDRKYHQRPKERNDTGENPRRNGLFGADPEICGLDRTRDPPIVIMMHQTQIRQSAQSHHDNRGIVSATQEDRFRRKRAPANFLRQSVLPGARL